MEVSSFFAAGAALLMMLAAGLSGGLVRKNLLRRQEILQGKLRPAFLPYA